MEKNLPKQSSRSMLVAFYEVFEISENVKKSMPKWIPNVMKNRSKWNPGAPRVGVVTIFIKFWKVDKI